MRRAEMTRRLRQELLVFEAEQRMELQCATTADHGAYPKPYVEARFKRAAEIGSIITHLRAALQSAQDLSIEG